MITMSKLTLTPYCNLQTSFSFCQLSYYDVLFLVQGPTKLGPSPGSPVLFSCHVLLKSFNLKQLVPQSFFV